MKTYEIEKNVLASLPIEKYKVLRPENNFMMSPYYQCNKILTIDKFLSTMSVAQYPKEFENKMIITHNDITSCWQDPKHILTAFCNINEFKYDTFIVDKDFRAKYNDTIKKMKAYKRENVNATPSLWVGGQSFLSKASKNTAYMSDYDIAPIEAIMKLSTAPQTITKIYVGQQVYKSTIKKVANGEYDYNMSCFDIVEVTDKNNKTILVGIFCPILTDDSTKQFKVDVAPIESGIDVDWQNKIKALDEK